MHDNLKQQKMQKRVKCFLRDGTESKKTSSHIILDSSNAFGLSRTIFSVPNNGEVGEEFKTMPPSGVQSILTGPNWHNVQLDHVFYKIRP